MFLCVFQTAITKGVEDTIQFEPYFVNYDKNDGLPSSIVHEVFQDSKGFMWFCTANGVCRFDGNSFVNYTTSDGICSNVVIHGAENDDGKIWFLTAANEIFYYDYKIEGFICPAIEPLQLTTDHHPAIQEIFPKGDEILFSFYYMHGRFTISDSGIQTSLFLPTDSFTIEKLTHNQNLLVGAKNFFENYGAANSYNLSYFSGIVASENCLLGTYGPRIFRFNTEGNKILDFASAPSLFTGELLVDSGFLFAGTFRDGLYIYNLQEGFSAFQKLFKGLTITSLVKDNEGGFWISTIEQGIYYSYGSFFDLPTVAVAQASKPSSSILSVGNNVFLSFYDGSCYKWHKKQNLLTSFFRLPTACDIRFSKSDSSIILYSGTSFEYNFVSHKYKQPPICAAFIYDGAGRVKNFIVNYQGRGLELDTLRHPSSRKLIAKSWDLGDTRYAFQTPDGHIYVAADQGVGYLNGETYRLESQVFLDSISQSFVSSGLLLGDLLIATTEGSGIFLLKDGKIIDKLTIVAGLPRFENLTCIAPNDDTSCWVGGSEGVYLISIKNQQLQVEKQLSFNTGFPLQNVSSIYGHGKFLFVGTESEVFKIDHVNMVPTKREDIYLHSVSFGDSVLKKTDYGYEATHDQRIITLKFSSPSFKNAFQHRYRYRIIGLDTSWREISSQELTMTGLSPGTYTIEIDKKNLSGKWSGAPLAVPLSVLPPFYKSTWFLLLLFSVSISIAGGIFYMRLRYYRKESALQIGLVKTRNQTLSSQLNPHFLYNVLNTVGGSIVREDKQDAVQTISKFSKLMRMVFDNSQHDLVPLTVELQAVLSYVELERKRMDNAFTFNFVHGLGSHEALSNYLVPPLLLQPLVENAIWHGISEMEGKGQVQLHVLRSGNSLSIVVRDNGKGLSKEKLNGHSRNSSLKIIVSRMKLLTEIYGKNVGWELVSKPKEGWKTEITIAFPVIENKQEEQGAGQA